MNKCCDCTYLDISQGDLNGKYWCEKRLERHSPYDLECARFCRAYSRDYSEKERAYNYSKEHTENTGCYLTTMLCNILKLPDNNYYLETMRSLRNNFMQKDEKYKVLLVEYDILGPKIANYLSIDPAKEMIAKKYFNDFIVPIVTLIEQKKNIEAINIYTKMTSSLKSLYNLNTVPTTLEIENADIKKSGHGKYKVKVLF